MTQVAVIEIRTPRSVVEVVRADIVTDLVEIITRGPMGPRGPAGGGGGDGGDGYVHEQTVPGTVWTIEHELGFDPAGVTVVSADGYLMEGFGIQYLVAGTTLRLSFDIAFAGTAYLS